MGLEMLIELLKLLEESTETAAGHERHRWNRVQAAA